MKHLNQVSKITENFNSYYADNEFNEAIKLAIRECVSINPCGKGVGASKGGSDEFCEYSMFKTKEDATIHAIHACLDKLACIASGDKAAIMLPPKLSASRPSNKTWN